MRQYTLISKLNSKWYFTQMIIREAKNSDAAVLSGVLTELVEAKKRMKASDAEFVKSHYTGHPHQIHCSIAIGDDGLVLGFQSLKMAKTGNLYCTPEGWGIIGTHIRPTAARQGVGAQLFLATKAAASKANLPKIEAFIGIINAPALAYYEAMGFESYRTTDTAICKVFVVA